VYLLDTNVISALAPGRGPSAHMAAFLERETDRLFISAITVAEVETGIAKLARQGAAARSNALGAWLEAVLMLYGARVLPFGTHAARLAGGLLYRAAAAGHAPGFADAAVAGIASAHSLTVLTRNMRHFAPFSVAALDPWESVPPA
jgi:predicted nucleic acid-binding protein